MIRGKGSLDEFMHAVFNLNPDEQQVVLYECDESEFYGFERNTLKNILVGSRLTSDRCRVISDGKDLEEKVFREGKSKNGIIQKYLQIDKLNSVFEDSATLAFDAIHEYDNYAKWFCGKIRNEYSVFTSANMYLSKGSSKGFGGHTDDHDFIAFQIEGAKDWNIVDRENRDSELHDNPVSLVTKPGMFLYVPKGFYHDPVAQDCISIHVTCSLTGPTYSDYFSWHKMQPYANDKIPNVNYVINSSRSWDDFKTSWDAMVKESNGQYPDFI